MIPGTLKMEGRRKHFLPAAKLYSKDGHVTVFFNCLLLLAGMALTHLSTEAAAELQCGSRGRRKARRGSHPRERQ